jgi:tRNA G10  N-methylase Trm11
MFIPGKNWQLSLAELASFFEARKCQFKITDLSKPFFVVINEKIIDPSLISDLGGIIKIGRVMSNIPSESLEEAFLRRNKQAQTEIKTNLSAEHVTDGIFKTLPKKCIFGVSIYFENLRFLRFSKKMQKFIGSYFKERLAAQGTRAKFMGFPKNRKLPQLTHVEVLKRSLIEKSAEILFCIGQKQALIGHTIAVHNPFEFQKRDISKPIQRKIFSIPPRLARIMVNLSSCLSGKVLLDPFCGVGTILQEAMLTKAKTIGMDINPWCVKASYTNLEWLKREYTLKDAKYRVLLGDSRHLVDQLDKESVDCIVTEPDLGPALRYFPTEHYARGITDKLKSLYRDFLEEAYGTLKSAGKLVLVTPYIKTRSGSFVSLDIKEKAEATGFKIIYPFRRESFVTDTPLIADLTKTSSFVDMEQRHKVGREIHILQK